MLVNYPEDNVIVHKWTRFQTCYSFRMGAIKDKNGMDLTEVEDIKKRWQEYTEGLYKKDLHDPHNNDGVITHLEPDIFDVKSSGP